MNIPDIVQHESLKQWVANAVALAKPDEVAWCDGSDEEYASMCGLLEEAGTFIRLNPELRPNSFLARSRGRAMAVESPIGWMPRYQDINWSDWKTSPRKTSTKLCLSNVTTGTRNSCSIRRISGFARPGHSANGAD